MLSKSIVMLSTGNEWDLSEIENFPEAPTLTRGKAVEIASTLGYIDGGNLLVLDAGGVEVIVDVDEAFTIYNENPSEGSFKDTILGFAKMDLRASIAALEAESNGGLGGY